MLLIILLMLMIAGCGSGGGESTEAITGGTLTASITTENISVKAGEKAKVTATTFCSSKDLFATHCNISTAIVENNGFKSEIPLGYTIKVGESKTFDIEVFSSNHMALEPFSYLNSNNPSTSTGGWTSYSEVLATTESKFVAFGDESCTQNLSVNPQALEVTRGSIAVYTILGGKPPYKITSSTNALPPSPTTVTTSGGTFSVSVPTTTTAIGATYTITDDAGEAVTSTLTISAPAAFSVFPTSVKVNGVIGGTARFDVIGGIPPYRIYSDNIAYQPNPTTLTGEGSFTVTVPADSPKTTVTYTAVDNRNNTKSATLEIERPSSQATSLSVKSQSQQCSLVNNFSVSIPEYTLGTLKIVAGEQTLEEKSFGVLSGKGSGTITKAEKGYTVSFSFSSPPAKGTPINAYYLTKPKTLSNNIKNESLRISYGDLTLSQSGNYLVDASGKVYGQIDNNKTINFTSIIAIKEAQLIAAYEGEPYNVSGGEIVGKGDGVSKTFTLKTKYAPLHNDSLKVFISREPAKLKSVNLLTGEFTAVFDNPPAYQEDIRASYVISKVNMPIKLTIDNLKFNLSLEVIK